MACREKGLLVFIYNGTGPCTGASCHSGMGRVRLLKGPWLHTWKDTSSIDATVLRNTGYTHCNGGIMSDVEDDKTIVPRVRGVQ